MIERFCIFVGMAVLSTVIGGCGEIRRVEALNAVAAGLQNMADGEHWRAQEKFDEAIRTDPQCGQAFYRKGMLQLQVNHDAQSALPALVRAEELMPSDADVLYQHAVALEASGKAEAAADRFAKVLSINPHHAGALYRVGVALERQGKPLDAIGSYEKSIRANAHLAPAYQALGNLYARYGRFDEAVAVFRNGIENNPGSSLLLAAAGTVAYDRGDVDAAISSLSQAVRLADAPLSAAYNLGAAYARRYERSGVDADRNEASTWLRRSLSACDPAKERARCETTMLQVQQLEAATR